MPGRRRSVLIWFPLIWLIAGCGLDKIEVTLEDQATIPMATIGSPFPVAYQGLSGLDFKSQKELANNGVAPGDIDGIFVRSVTVSGTEAKDDLGALIESLEFRIGGPNLDKQRIAWKSPVPNGQSTTLDIDDTTNLKSYGVAESMTIDSDLVLRQQPAFRTSLDTKIVLLVDLNIAGL